MSPIVDNSKDDENTRYRNQYLSPAAVNCSLLSMHPFTKSPHRLDYRYQMHRTGCPHEFFVAGILNPTEVHIGHAPRVSGINVFQAVFVVCHCIHLDVRDHSSFGASESWCDALRAAKEELILSMQPTRE